MGANGASDWLFVPDPGTEPTQSPVQYIENQETAMIVPEGMVVKLDPKDDFLHEPEAASNYNESVYIDMFDSRTSLGAWLRIGNRPNEGYAEVSVCMYLPDGRVAFWFVRPEIQDNSELNAGGLRVQVAEPFKTLEVSYEGPVILLDDPMDLQNAREAFKQSPRADASMRFTLSGVSPMHGGEIVNRDGSPWQLDPELAAYRGHMEQHLSVTGEMRIDGEIYPFDGHGFRDKSWGPRHWGNLYWHKWLPITFGPDFGVLLALMGRPDQQPEVVGHIWRGERLIPLTDARLNVTYDDEFVQRSIMLDLETAEGTTTVSGEVVTAIPLQHRRIAEDGTETRVRIIKAMTQFKCEGRQTTGMSEFLDLMVGDRPISLTTYSLDV
ncbi:hypothetical protein D1224_10545 [Henriciella barbarensis]|uniref:DUF7064 domain-containing protein n=2 Tax=Henriciella barbarensis TaxID=86342 RepID=A0A399QZQ9_9PROT|nr:hypothetical protein D1224_10545 [Henriciella barbarensis]